MKLFKKIIAIASVVAVFGTTALADMIVNNTVEVPSTATQVEVQVGFPVGTTIGAFSSFELTYDNSVLTYVNEETTTGYGVIDSYDDELVIWSTTSLVTVTEAGGTNLVTYKFNINDGLSTPEAIAALEDATFEITNWMMYADDDMSVEISAPSNAVISIKVEESEDKTVTTQTATNGATQIKYGADVADADKVLAGKYVVMNSVETPVGLTAASRVVVKYEDAQNPALNKEVEYGKTIFEYLGITGEGKTTTKGIKFGVVYEDANYKAANFTFTIK